MRKRWTISTASDLRRGGDKCQRGSGAGSMQSALPRATRGSQDVSGGATTSQRRVRRLGPAPRHRGAQATAEARGREEGYRKAKGLWREGLCWRRRPQPTYAHMQLPSSPSAQSRHPMRRMERPASERLCTVRIGVEAAQGGRRERPSRAEGVRARAKRACVRARARAQSVHDMPGTHCGSARRAGKLVAIFSTSPYKPLALGRFLGTCCQAGACSDNSL